MKIKPLLIGGFILAASLAAKADTYSCTVLLCLAHPAGYEQIAQCGDPIRQLRGDLAVNKKPVCDEAKPQADMSFVRQQYFDSCPNGTSTLGSNTRVLQMTPANFELRSRVLTAGSNVGTAETGTVAISGLVDDGNASAEVGMTSGKVCIGDYLGQLNAQRAVNGELTMDYEEVGVYERVAVMGASGTSWIATVFIDGLVSKVTTLN